MTRCSLLYSILSCLSEYLKATLVHSFKDVGDHFEEGQTRFDMTRTDSKHFTMMKPFLNKGSTHMMCDAFYVPYPRALIELASLIEPAPLLKLIGPTV